MTGRCNSAWSRKPAVLERREGALLESNSVVGTRRLFVDSFAVDNGTRREAMPRELIDSGTDKRYVRRDEEGRFKESVDVGRSLAADQRQHAKTRSKKGEGDRGDR